MQPFFALITRFIVSGSVAAGAMLGVLYVLHSLLGLWYLSASAMALCVAVSVNYVLQRSWTFGANGGARRGTFAQFVTVNVLAACTNAALMFVLVDLGQVHYLIAQMAVQALLALVSFIAYARIFSGSGRLLDNPHATHAP